MTQRLLTLLAAVALTGACSPGTPPGPLQHDHASINLDGSPLSRVALTMGAGELHVKGGADKLAEADFAYNVATWKPSVIQNLERTPPELTIAQGAPATSAGDTKNRWDVALNDRQPLEIVAHLGAGAARMDLATLTLRRVELSVGAGQVDMDLRGHPTTSYAVSIHGGVGEATVHLPTDVAITATASGGLGDIKVSGLEQRDGRWINPRVPTSSVTIDLDIKGGVGQINIDAN